MKRLTLVLMPDYTADPLWATHEGGVMVSIDSLPLSDGTKSALRIWAAWFDHTDYNDTSRYFKDEDELKSFVRVGEELHKALQAELPDWEILYAPPPRFRAAIEERG